MARIVPSKMVPLAQIVIAVVGLVVSAAIMAVVALGANAVASRIMGWTAETFGEAGLPIVVTVFIGSTLLFGAKLYRRSQRRQYARDLTIHVEKPRELPASVRAFVWIVGIPLWLLVIGLAITAVFVAVTGP